MSQIPGNESVGSVAISTAGSMLSGASHGDRDVFAADELAIVLSHFDIGILSAIQEYPRGSRRAPKLLVRSDKGVYLLKRRARGKDDPFKVAFCHSIQLDLAAKQFPLPHLIGTRKDNNSMLQYKGAIYELFEYIKGTGYDSSLDATQDSGKTLGLFHKLLSAHESKYDPPRGSYHASRMVRAAIDQMHRTLETSSPRSAQDIEEIERLVSFARDHYNQAADQVDAAGLTEWPAQIIHSDWHPGNMLYRGTRVVAIIDYDTARVLQRVIDIANGALQFSIIGGGDDPLKWPEGIDLARFKRFMIGYDTVPDNVLTTAELRITPALMVQALIAEAVIPIAKTGLFARMDGGVFLEMVRRKCGWLIENATQLVQLVDG